MLRVTLEMVPFGIEERKRTIGTIEISNVGGNAASGNYKVRHVRDDGWEGSVELFAFPRKRGAWSLLLRALLPDQELPVAVRSAACCESRLR